MADRKAKQNPDRTSELRILLTGTTESEKNEIPKFWKLLYQDGYNLDDLRLWRPTIFHNFVSCAQILLRAMKQFDICLDQEGNRGHYDFLLDYSIDPNTDEPLEALVEQAISSLWQDPCIPKVLDRSGEFYIMDTAS